MSRIINHWGSVQRQELKIIFNELRRSDMCSVTLLSWAMATILTSTERIIDVDRSMEVLTKYRTEYYYFLGICILYLHIYILNLLLVYLLRCQLSQYPCVVYLCKWVGELGP